MRLTTILAALFLIALPALAADITIQGTYTSSFKNNRPNVLNGTLTKTDDGKYDANFTTDWQGTVQTFQGTVTGNLEKGDLKGDFYLMNGDRKGRHFIFSATTDNFTAKGKTFEIVGNRQNPTGVLSFKKVEPPASPPAK